MPLPKPRPGESIGFRIHPSTSDESTLGNPEKIIWSSINQLCVRDYAEVVLYETHNVRNRRKAAGAARNLKLYIRQAFEFYEAAEAAKPNTAPLFYYYSFLHLAKALCEILYPRFHKRPESYRHGIRWKPSRQYLVYMPTESVWLTRQRGVWHVLWEALVGQPCHVPRAQALRIKDLFSFCSEVTTEYERTFGREMKLVELFKPDILIDNNDIWIKFSVYRIELAKQRISRPTLLQLITLTGSPYRQVESENADLWTFELEQPKKYGPRDLFFDVLSGEIKAFNMFVSLHWAELFYAVPLQTRLPILLPQIMVLYTLMFWLGSLVRYDPHSVDALQDSGWWILIDGFMNQSRIWLLELFEWEFYKTETTLVTAR